MTLLKPLLSSLVLIALALQAESSPLDPRQISSGTTSSTGSQENRPTSSYTSTSGPAEPLSTEVGYLGATTEGPPTSVPIEIGYPGLAQATAFYSAQSVANKLGNITVPFAQPIGFTSANIYSNVAHATAYLPEYVCPSGMIGVGYRCCPGVAVEGQCLRTDTASLAPYATFTGVVLAPSENDTNGSIELGFGSVWYSFVLVAFVGAMGVLV